MRGFSRTFPGINHTLNTRVIYNNPVAIYTLGGKRNFNINIKTKQNGMELLNSIVYYVLYESDLLNVIYI